MSELWAHQQKAIAEAKDRTFYGLFFDPGTGKTRTAIEILRAKWQLNAGMQSTLILCPPIVIQNWKNEFLKYSRVPAERVVLLTGTGKQRVEKLKKARALLGDRFIAVTNYESTIIPALHLHLMDWAPRCLVADECFSTGTLVDTPSGPVPIERLVPGDLVINCLGTKKVVGTFKRRVTERVTLVFGGKAVTCSANHLWLTSSGWVPAKEIAVGALLIPTEKALRAMSKVVQTEETCDSFLREILLCDVALPKHRPSVTSLSEFTRETSAALACADVAGQPDARPRVPRQGQCDIEGYGAQAVCTGWQWTWPSSGGKAATGIFRAPVAVELYNPDGATTRLGLPYVLQTGSLFLGEEDYYRGRRGISQLSPSPCARLEERDVSDCARVESISYHQSPGDGGPGDYLYDLEVEGHPSFSVEGVVVHNSHRCKDIQAKRTKATIALADRADIVRLGLSGTPVLNSPMDLFSQYRILDGGENFGKNFFAFRASHMKDRNAYMPKQKYFPDWVPTEEGNRAISAVLQKTALVVKKEECLDLPPLVQKVIEVELSPEQRRVYDDMKKDFIAYIGDQACVAQLAITKALRLQQIVSGHLPVESEGGEQVVKTFTGTPRLAAFRELLLDIAPHHKVLVWAVFKQDYGALKHVCDDLGFAFVEVHGEIPQRGKDVAVEAFRSDPKVRVLIGHPQSAGLGVNLVEASYTVYYSRGFSLEQRLQSEARNYRAGSERHEKITQIDLVARGTIDELINAALQTKTKLSVDLLRQEFLP